MSFKVGDGSSRIDPTTSSPSSGSSSVQSHQSGEIGGLNKLVEHDNTEPIAQDADKSKVYDTVFKNCAINLPTLPQLPSLPTLPKGVPSPNSGLGASNNVTTEHPPENPVIAPKNVVDILKGEVVNHAETGGVTRTQSENDKQNTLLNFLEAKINSSNSAIKELKNKYLDLQMTGQPTSVIEGRISRAEKNRDLLIGERNEILQTASNKLQATTEKAETLSQKLVNPEAGEEVKNSETKVPLSRPRIATATWMKKDVNSSSSTSSGKTINSPLTGSAYSVKSKRNPEQNANVTNEFASRKISMSSTENKSPAQTISDDHHPISEDHQIKPMSTEKTSITPEEKKIISDLDVQIREVKGLHKLEKQYRFGSTTNVVTANNTRNEIIDNLITSFKQLSSFAEKNPNHPFSAEFKTFKENNNKDAFSTSPYAQKEFFKKAINDLTLTNLIESFETAISTSPIQAKGVEILETIVLNQQEMIATSSASKITALSNELKQMSGVLREAGDKKITLNEENGQLELNKKKGLAKLGITRGEGKDEDVNTFKSILAKIKGPHLDPSLKPQAEEIITLLENNIQFTGACKADTSLKKELEEVKGNLLNKTDNASSLPKFNIASLLSPPRNNELQKEFLTSYRSIASELTGDKTNDISDSQKLISFISNKFTNPDTSLYEKQELVLLTESWVSNPFFNGNQVSEVKDEIKGLIDLTKGSTPKLKALGEGLLMSLDKATSLEESAKVNGPLFILDGKKDPQVLFNQIRNGDLKPGTEAYQKEVKNFAKTMELQSALLVKGMAATEFNNQAWDKGKDKGLAPNNVALSKYTNSMVQFMTASVLGDNIVDSTITTLSDDVKKAKQQEIANAIEFCVHVQNELISPANGNVDLIGITIISEALSLAVLKRITPAFDLLPAEITENKLKYSDLTGPGQDYKQLREKNDELMKKQTPFMPYMGPILKDLVYVGEKIPKTNKKDGIINADFITKQGQILTKFNDNQKLIKIGNPNNEELFNLNGIYSKIDEEAMWVTSELILPRPPKKEKSELK